VAESRVSSQPAAAIFHQFPWIFCSDVPNGTKPSSFVVVAGYLGRSEVVIHELGRELESVASSVLFGAKMPILVGYASQHHHYKNQHFDYTFADVFADTETSYS